MCIEMRKANLQPGHILLFTWTSNFLILGSDSTSKPTNMMEDEADENDVIDKPTDSQRHKHL